MTDNGDSEVLRLEVPSPETLQQRVTHSAPSYGKPVEVGHYSVNGKGELVHDRSELVPFPPPPHRLIYLYSSHLDCRKCTNRGTTF